MTRRVLVPEQVGEDSSGDKQAVMKKIIESDDIVHCWEKISHNQERKYSDALLAAIIELWATMRGFSHACSLMEAYKKEQKKGVEKSKGLRLKLNATFVEQ